MREISSELVEKYKAECLYNNFTYIGRGNKNDTSLVKCNECGEISEKYQGSMRRFRVGCQKCLTQKWTAECESAGFKFIKKVDAKKALCECFKCSNQGLYDMRCIRRNMISCNKCLEIKWSKECDAVGFEYLGRGAKVRLSRIMCKMCLTTYETDQANIRDKGFRCNKCLEIKWSKECDAVGFEYLGRGAKISHVTVKCKSCENIGQFNMSLLRRGMLRCSGCRIQKYKSVVKAGWTYIDKILKNHNTYVVLTHDCSDIPITVGSGHFLNGKYDCPHCMHSHFDEQSYFYVIKVTNNNNSIIKIGVANNIDRRFRQYGLPDDAILEIVHVKPFDTKRLAITFESMMKQALKDYKVDNEDAKTIFTLEGFTECFSIDSLETIKQLI